MFVMLKHLNSAVKKISQMSDVCFNVVLAAASSRFADRI